MDSRVKITEQEPEKRAKNFDEVCLGYTLEEAKKEASRCLKCNNPLCVKKCPVSINIPEFIRKVEEGKIVYIQNEMKAATRLWAEVMPYADRVVISKHSRKRLDRYGEV